MGSFDDSGPVPVQVRTGQIIVGAMITGVCIFLLITYVMQGAQPGGANPPAGVGPLGAKPLLSYIVGPFIVATNLALLFVVPRLMTSTARKKIATGQWTSPPSRTGAPLDPTAFITDESKLAAVYLTQLIVSAALLESAAFFMCIAYFLDRLTTDLVVALALVAGLIFLFPTRERASSWLEAQRAELERERQPGT